MAIALIAAEGLCTIIAWAITIYALRLARCEADHARSALRCYDALVQRLVVDRSTSLAPAQPDLPELVEDKPYISDLPHDDKHWNDFLGVEDEDDE